MLSYRCNAECSDCGTFSNPRIREKLESQDVLAAIQQAAALGFKNVVFTGGEATLHEKLLCNGLREARARGLSTRLVTNGVWANSMERARRKLRTWTDSGLDEINLSTGDQHQRFVPAEFVSCAIEAACEANLRCLLMIEKRAQSVVTKRQFLESESLSQLFDSGRFGIIESPWMPLDPRHVREYPIGDTATNKNLAKFAGCDSILQTYVLGTDSGVYCCCGIGCRAIDELKSTRAFDRNDEHSLHSIIYEAEQDFLKLWIRAEGTEKILAWCASKRPELGWEGMYAHRCQACLRIYSDPVVGQIIREHHREKIPDVVFREFVASSMKELSSA